MRNLLPLAWLVMAVLAIDGVWDPVLLIASSWFPQWVAATHPSGALQTDLATLGMMLVTAIVFGTWTYLAGRNLVDAGYTDLEFSPGSRVWWFFVPIASLWKPFQGMRELWNASHGEGAYDVSAGFVTLWWALYLGGGIVGGVLQGMAAVNPSESWLLWAVSALEATTAAVASLMVLRITRAQRRLDGPALTEVFA